jgi:hypothetical protein
MDAVAVAGKNISKLSFLGKETSRCNLKLYGEKRPHTYINNYEISQRGGVIGMVNYLESL